MRCDVAYAPDARHHVAKVEFHARLAQAKCARPPRLVYELCRPIRAFVERNEIEASPPIRRPSTSVTLALATAAILGGDQAGRAPADDDQGAVETPRFVHRR